MASKSDDPNDEMMIAYVRGRLSGEDADRITSEAARRADVRAEIELMRGISAAIEEDAKAPGPGDLGWARLSRVLDAEAPRPAPQARRPLWQLAAVAAAAILFWQMAAVPLLFNSDGRQAEYAPVTELPAEDVTLSVVFRPTATEEAIRLLLLEVDAQISAGPSAVGLWQFRFESKSAREEGFERLENEGIVESVQR
jgi:anti-sigma factor RsiW